MKTLPALLLASAAIASPCLALANDGLNVVTSIKPIYSLATALTEGTPTETTLLVQGAASPHTYSMSPSQARSLQEADVIFWIGPSLEHFLGKPLEALGANADIVELEDVPGVETLAMREGGNFDAHDHGDNDDDDDHDHEGHDHDDDHHAHGEVDAHMWLDPVNAQAFVKAMAATLASDDPENAAIYSANAEKIDSQLQKLQDGISARLATVEPKPYVVFHDAYHYYGHRFGVEASGSVTVNPEAPPSAARVREIREKLQDLGTACVFSEPQFPPKIIDAITEGLPVASGTLDPLGADLEDGPELYFAVLNNLTDNLIACFND